MRPRHRTPALAFLLVATAAAGAQAPPAAAVPGALAGPGEQAAMTLSATGVQVYECRAGAADRPPEWAVREPRADLFLAGRRIGRHYAGPTWEHEDGSAVIGRNAARVEAPEPGDIPWLRLDVATRRGAGAFGGVVAIQRINTRGGVLAGSCPEPGRVSEVPYASDYVMLRRT